MRRFRLGTTLLSAALFLFFGVATVLAAAQRYCPPGGILSTADNASMSIGSGAVYCLHLGAGDGFTQMADGSPSYIFGFQDVVAEPLDTLIPNSTLGAQFPAPTLRLKEGNTYFINLTNVGLQNRPDLFDPHTIHFHGFPNQIPFYDGEPMGSFGTNMGATFTYFYQPHDPGTYMFHCHQEAAEHMQMGMLGAAFIDPIQNDNLTLLASLGTARVGTALAFQGFAYNDNDTTLPAALLTTTAYDVQMPLQLAAFDPYFHWNDMCYQPPRFAFMDDLYPMFNGRGYPDTVNTDDNTAHNINVGLGHTCDVPISPQTGITTADPEGAPYEGSRPMNSLVTIASNQSRVLLRIYSLSTTSFHTIESPAIPMRVVGRDARIFRGGGVPSGLRREYLTNSVTLGGGESIDVILDVGDPGSATRIPDGTYFLYSRELDHLNNNRERRGGMMTEIIVQ
jgi:FtsP/CotA-like multicopper oxidase with cupredoxin domain